MTNLKFITVSTLALAAELALGTSPAVAATCDLNGVNGSVNAAIASGGAISGSPESLACGPFASTLAAVAATAIGRSAFATGNFSTAIGYAAGGAFFAGSDAYTIAIGAWSTTNSVLGGIAATNFLDVPAIGGFGSVDVGTGTQQAGTDNVQVGNFSNMGSSTALVTASTSLGEHHDEREQCRNDRCLFDGNSGGRNRDRV